MNDRVHDERAVPGLRAFASPTMGTTLQVQVFGVDEGLFNRIAPEVCSAVASVDHEMSTYKPQSDLCRFNAAPVGEWISVSDNVVRVVEAALGMGELSAGRFDIAVLDLVQAWGFGPTGLSGATPGPVPKAELARATFRDISIRHRPPALRKARALEADLSGIAKGFGVDEAARVLEAAGVENYLVEIAGEVRAAGLKADGVPWTVGLELPVPGRRIVHDQLPLHNCAMATSGVYRQFREIGENLVSHTIDPSTAAPVRNGVLAVTVVADTCMLADALATVLMLMPVAEGVNFCDANAIAASIIGRDCDSFRDVRTLAFARRFPMVNAPE